MLKKLQSKKEQGFTIIEVLIVLAVGGLIIAIVLLAVPALQRNQRNSARGTDAGRIATAAANYASDNNGKLPTAADATVAQAILDDAGSLGQYTLAGSAASGASKFNVQPATAQITTAPTTADQVTVVLGSKCNGKGVTAAANARQMALVYTTESANGYTAVCKDV